MLWGVVFFFFFQAEDGIRDGTVTGVQTCALPISRYQWSYIHPESLEYYHQGYGVDEHTQDLSYYRRYGVVELGRRLGRYLRAVPLEKRRNYPVQRVRAQHDPDDEQYMPYATYVCVCNVQGIDSEQCADKYYGDIQRLPYGMNDCVVQHRLCFRCGTNQRALKYEHSDLCGYDRCGNHQCGKYIVSVRKSREKFVYHAVKEQTIFLKE